MRGIVDQVRPERFLPLLLALFASCFDPEAAETPDLENPVSTGNDDSGVCQPGTEACPCYPNRTCNDELRCLSNVCVDLGAPTSATDSTPPDDTGGNTADDGESGRTGDEGSTTGQTTADSSGTTPSDLDDGSNASTSDGSGAPVTGSDST